MKKTVLASLLLTLFCLVIAVPAFAEGTSPRLMDAADLLSDEEEQALLTQLNEASDRAQYDIVVVTLTTLEGTSIGDAAVQLFDTYQFGYGDTYDGTIFLVSMAERDTQIESFGIGQYVLDSRTRDAIFDAVIPSLSAGDYYDAFSLYAAYTEEVVTAARATGAYDNYWDDPSHYGYTEDPYGSYEYTKAPFNAGGSIFIGLLISLIIAAISTGSMKSQLKSVQQQRTAGTYVRRDSLNLTDSRERFLYSNIARTPKAQAAPRTSNARPSGSSGGYRPSAGGHSGSSHKF